MYKNFEEAKAGAIEVINKLYGGDKMGCCVCESKLSKRSRTTSWGFRFYSEDTNGEFVMLKDGTYMRMYKI